jgi:hypothetical protein
MEIMVLHDPATSVETTPSEVPMAEIEPGAVEWLLGGDAAIRWQTRRDLLDQPEEVYAHDRAAVSTTGWGRRLLDLQSPDGTWGGGLYGPKWTSTAYTLLLLRRCGLEPTDARARRGVEQLWDGARYFDGALTTAATIDLPEACITSMYVALACYFGVEDPRVDDALAWLLDNQLPDGGWNCRNVRFGDRHSSFHTSILALEACAEAQRSDRAEHNALSSALDGGREFFLAHRLYRSHRTGKVVDPALTRLSFPPRWRYDILRGLGHFAATDAPWDQRFHDALDVLDGKRRKDGSWPVQQKHAGTVWFDMEQTGGPSRWNTLRALRVLRWAGRARSETER